MLFKINSRYFNLTGKVFWSFILHVCVTLGVIICVGMNYLVIQETDACDTQYDCFLVKGLNVTRVTDCTNYDGTVLNNIQCYYIDIQPTVAFALMGGFIKIVPLWIFYTMTALYLIILQRVHWVFKVIVHVLALALLISGLVI